MTIPPPVLFLFTLNSICGYGIEAFGANRQEALTLGKKKYFAMRKDCGPFQSHMNTFKKACDYFGCSMRKVTAGDVGDEGTAGEVVEFEIV